MLSKRYFNTVLRRFEQLVSQTDAFRMGAVHMADAVLKDGKIYAYDREQALMIEASGRAAGLAAVNGYSKGTKLSSADVLIIGAVEPDTPDMHVLRLAFRHSSLTP